MDVLLPTCLLKGCSTLATLRSVISFVTLSKTHVCCSVSDWRACLLGTWELVALGIPAFGSESDVDSNVGRVLPTKSRGPLKGVDDASALGQGCQGKRHA